MSVEYHQNLLAEISGHSQEEALRWAATTVNEYTELVKSGQMTKEEYTELVKDVQRQINIREGMSELQSLEKLNTAINGLVSIARLA